MKQTLLIALLSLAGFTAPLSFAADAPAVEPARAAAPDNLSAPGKPCNKPGMGPGMGAGMGAMMMGGGRSCQKPGAACDCPMHKEMSARVEQLEKRIDALQTTIEVLARQHPR